MVKCEVKGVELTPRAEEMLSTEGGKERGQNVLAEAVMPTMLIRDIEMVGSGVQVRPRLHDGQRTWIFHISSEDRTVHLHRVVARSHEQNH